MEPQNSLTPQDQNNPQPQVIKPEAMFNPSVPPQPPAPNPQTPTTTPSQNTMPPISGNSRQKKPLIILGVVIAVLALISVIAIVLVSGNGNNNNNQNQQPAEDTGIIKEPSALDIENANNSISSDLTGLNDENDFPANNLSNENLQL